MNETFQFLLKHGGPVLFLVGFAEQSGLPFPGSFVVIAAGALAAKGKFDLLAAIGWTALGCITADAILFVLGRRDQARVFRVFPHLGAARVRLERATLARTVLHGVRMLTVAKFLPLGQVVALHAGALRVNRLRFLLVDAFSSVVYATVFAALGFAFHSRLEQLVAFLQKLGTVSWVALALAAAAWGVYGLVKRRRAPASASTNPPQETQTRETLCIPCSSWQPSTCWSHSLPVTNPRTGMNLEHETPE